MAGDNAAVTVTLHACSPRQGCCQAMCEDLDLDQDLDPDPRQSDASRCTLCGGPAV
jgi:hypothetical protein